MWGWEMLCTTRACLHSQLQEGAREGQRREAGSQFQLPCCAQPQSIPKAGVWGDEEQSPEQGRDGESKRAELADEAQAGKSG